MGKTVAEKNIASPECKAMGIVTARPIFEDQETHLPMVKGTYIIIWIREKDRSADRHVCEDRFELNGRVASGGFIPIAMHPKIVAKSNGPGGVDALIYNSTADPIKRNTAIIAVGYPKNQHLLSSARRKTKYPSLEISSGKNLCWLRGCDYFRAG